MRKPVDLSKRNLERDDDLGTADPPPPPKKAKVATTKGRAPHKSAPQQSSNHATPRASSHSIETFPDDTPMSRSPKDPNTIIELDDGSDVEENKSDDESDGLEDPEVELGQLEAHMSR